MKNIGFILLTALLILVTGCSMGGVALCMPKGQVKANEAYFSQLEEEYVQKVREVLDEAGLTNAGVMLTHVREADGSRIYTLSIHHKRYFNLETGEQQMILQSLEECAFEADDCCFIQNFS